MFRTAPISSSVFCFELESPLTSASAVRFGFGHCSQSVSSRRCLYQFLGYRGGSWKCPARALAFVCAVCSGYLLIVLNHTNQPSFFYLLVSIQNVYYVFGDCYREHFI